MCRRWQRHSAREPPVCTTSRMATEATRSRISQLEKPVNSSYERGDERYGRARDESDRHRRPSHRRRAKPGIRVRGWLGSEDSQVRL
jgi:hypothetical protein